MKNGKTGIIRVEARNEKNLICSQNWKKKEKKGIVAIMNQKGA